MVAIDEIPRYPKTVSFGDKHFRAIVQLGIRTVKERLIYESGVHRHRPVEDISWHQNGVNLALLHVAKMFAQKSRLLELGTKVSVRNDAKSNTLATDTFQIELGRFARRNRFVGQKTAGLQCTDKFGVFGIG